MAFTLRLPEDLALSLGAAARAARRSVHAEILLRLERSFELEPEPWPLRPAAERGRLASDVPPLLEERPTRQTRTALCEHRVPAGSFCKLCDG